MNTNTHEAPVVELTSEQVENLRQAAEQLGENGEVLLQRADTEQPVVD